MFELTNLLESFLAVIVVDGCEEQFVGVRRRVPVGARQYLVLLVCLMAHRASALRVERGELDYHRVVARLTPGGILLKFLLEL